VISIDLLNFCFGKLGLKVLLDKITILSLVLSNQAIVSFPEETRFSRDNISNRSFD